jgi:hypothetical protein
MSRSAGTLASRAASAAPADAPDQVSERNWILRGLPADEYARLLPHLERVTLETLEVLGEPGGRLEYAFFPGSAIISVVRPIDDILVEAGTNITVLDREGLERLSCECYRVNRAHLQRLMEKDALPGS